MSDFFRNFASQGCHDGHFRPYCIDKLRAAMGKGVLTPNLELELKRFNLI